MPVVVLSVVAGAQSTAPATIERISVSRDSGEKRSALRWDIDLEFGLVPEDAERVERLLPGAAVMVEDKQPRKEIRRSTSKLPDIRIILHAGDGGLVNSEPVIEGKATVRMVELRAAKAQRSLTLRVRMAGDAAQAPALLRSLGKVVNVIVEQEQATLDFGRGESDGYNTERDLPPPAEDDLP